MWKDWSLYWDGRPAVSGWCHRAARDGWVETLTVAGLGTVTVRVQPSAASGETCAGRQVPAGLSLSLGGWCSDRLELPAV